MRKLIISFTSAVVIVAAIGVFAPFGLGVLAERQFKEMVDVADAHPGVYVTLKNYHRGWFRSDAEFTLKTTDHFMNFELFHRILQMTEMPYTLNLDIKTNIHHGPFMWLQQNNQHQFKIGLAAVDSNVQLINSNLKSGIQAKAENISFYGSAKLNGYMSITLDVPSVTFDSKEQRQTVRIDNFKGQWEVSPRKDKMMGNVQVSELQLINQDNNKLSLKNLTVNYRQAQHITDNGLKLWLGDSLLTLPTLDMEIAGKNKINLKDFSINIENHIIGKNQLTGSAQNSINQIIVNGQKYGPIHYIYQMNNVDAGATAELQHLLYSIQQQDSTSVNQMNMLAMLNTIEKMLFNQGAKVELKGLDIMTPDGQIHAKGQVVFANSPNTQANKNIAPNPTQLNMQIPNPLTWMQKINLQFNLNMPIAVAEKSLIQMYSNLLHKQQKQQMAQQTNSNLLNTQTNVAQGTTPVPGQANPSTATAYLGARANNELNAHTPPTVISAQNSANNMSNIALLNEEQIAQIANQQAKQQLNKWVNNGTLQESGGQYTVAIQLKQGQVLINGKLPATDKPTPVISSPTLTTQASQ